MTYVKTDCGSYLRTSHIREFRFENEDSVTLELDNGGRREVARDVWDRSLQLLSWERFPALAGTFLLREGAAANCESEFVREPIIAWAHTGIGELYAISMSGVHLSGHDSTIILFPDGTVRDCERCWDSYESWLKDQQVGITEGAGETEGPDRTVN